VNPILLRLWQLPLPRSVRRLAGAVALHPVVQRLVFPRFAVGIVGIIRDGDRYLLLRHTYRHTYPWGLPTGFLEHGEQPVDALRREIREEVGLHVEVTRLLATYIDMERPDLVNVVYGGNLIGGEFVASPEVSEYGLFSIDELPPMLPEQLQLLDLGGF